MHPEKPAERRRLVLACHGVTWVFGLLYLLALTVFLIGSFGLFGRARDPLAGVYLVLLGLPWNRLVDLAPEGLWPWLAAASPAVNLMVIRGICCRVRRGSWRREQP